MTAHVVQRLLDAEDLVRRRRADEYRRHVASQRSARIDPNPHQIDAVIFALTRIPDGGCILADEVGLGKTIEAGLVVAQLLAEGARRVLVVTPKALLGQWKQELFSLFSLETREITRDNIDFTGDGVFLATRDLIGSETGSAALEAGERFDLCIIDEAHEVFAGIYRRYDKSGSIREDSPFARMAARLSAALRATGTPVLLLTATPIQNSLLELWGLIQYVDATGTLLGDLSTFRQIFCPSDDRILEEGQEHELQRRLNTVMQRTLRRQAQEFMHEPFMGRQARLFEYAMSPEERELYDDVTNYLLESGIYAFSGKSRQLLLLVFHRRMASSHPALSKSLQKVAERLRKMRDGRAIDDEADGNAVLGDLEDEDTAAQPEASTEHHNAGAIAAELARVESFISRCEALPTDSKARAMLQAVRLVLEQATLGKSSGKVVIFTESLTTQDYLRKLLIESGVVDDSAVTLFRGTNDSPAAARALDQWLEDVGRKLPPDQRPSEDVAMRLALVDEFLKRSKILISTEAGAKGLNLQFCNTVINYDLPWNPQRIEQRIGRCHRYGQQRDVTVINFIAKDNEAQRLTFLILSEKLELFGTVLGATDEVLHRPGQIGPEALVSAVGGDFETQLRRIYDRARTIAEVEKELRELRDSMEIKRREFEAAQKRTEDVIQRRFDTRVQQSFRRIQQQLPAELAEFDQHVERVVVAYLEASAIPFTIERRDGTAILSIEPSSRLPEALREGTACLIGSLLPNSPLFPLHLGHPLVAAALSETRAAAQARAFSLSIRGSAPDLAAYRNRRGRVRIARVHYRGFESTDRLVPVIVLDGDDGPLSDDVAARLLRQVITDRPPSSTRSQVSDESLEDALESLLFQQTGEAGTQEHERFEQTIEQVERFLGDRILLLERQRDAALAKLSKAETAREAAVGSEQRDRAEQSLRRTQSEIERLDTEIASLRAGDDENYRRWRDRAQERRYAPPEVERIFDAELEIT